MKKILVPGGTGAMGVYLIPKLLKMGYKVDVISRDDWVSDNPNLKYIVADAKDYNYIENILKNDYDAVVDFMIYPTMEMMEKFLPLYLSNTGHYFYFSTYRVYANEEHPVKETSPRLLDVSKDEVLLNRGDYSIFKAQGEEWLKKSVFDNWTVVRPAITYSKRRFQLVTMEYDLVLRRMIEGKKVIVPQKALNVQATMSWAGDVAEMLARLVLNKAAYRETYSVCTAEHHSWEDVAKIYNKIGGLEYIPVSTEDYLDVFANGEEWAKYQLIADRYFDRIMDNSKILNATGMKQSELMPLEKGLALEYERFPKDFVWNDTPAYIRMEEYLKNKS